MANSDDENLREFIITWRIENFSFSWHKNGEEILSPEFCAHTFESTEWRLSVCPRGRTKNDYISCLLKRNFIGPQEIRLNVEILFLGHDGSTLSRRTSTDQSFVKGTEKGYYSFVKRNEVFAEKRTEFLPEDILTVRCRLWTSDINSIKAEQLFAVTRLEVVRKLLSGIVGGFSSIPTDEKMSVRLISAPEDTNGFKMNLHLTDGTNCDENLMLQIIFPENQPKKFSTCKVYLLDAEINKLECGTSRINLEQEQDWEFLLFPTKWKLLAKKDLYLPNDILTLECEIIISTGVLYAELIRTGDKLPPVLITIPNVDRFGDSVLSSSALNDFGNLYRDQVLCDVTLKTSTESFPAHTVILSARSDVFRAMFTNDMKEKMNACVDILDFDSETVRHLLQYAYTDTVGDLTLDTAFQLYAAADKYAIISLKKKCSTFLKEFLCTSKACELLVLADTHQDADLKKFSQNYISQNYDKICDSSEWKDLELKNPKLLIDILSQMYRSVRPF